ncbi:MAG TPA: hypothetical protein VF808_16250 [Ktedonobacterales bacterium]
MDQYKADGHAPVSGSAVSVSTRPPAAVYAAGSLEFYGRVRSVDGDSIAVGMPDGEILTIDVIPGQTDLAHNGHAMPVKGELIKAYASARHDGSFAAVEIGRASRARRYNLALATYRGITTGAVRGDRLLHLQVGLMTFTFPISASAALSDFDERAQSIEAGDHVAVEVEFDGTRGTAVAVMRG